MSDNERPRVENRQSFMARVADLPRQELLLIDFAYDLAKIAHRGQFRDTGERYSNHPKDVALILLDECLISTCSTVCICELHDTGEDTVLLGNRWVSLPNDTRPRYHQWLEVVRFRLQMFGSKITEAVIALTKPEVDGVLFTSKQAVMEHYLKGLWEADVDAVLVKMADRLHNLRSLSDNTAHKQQKTVVETEQVYWALFTQRVLPAYPQEGQYLLGQMRLEMNKYK